MDVAPDLDPNLRTRAPSGENPACFRGVQSKAEVTQAADTISSDQELVRFAECINQGNFSGAANILLEETCPGNVKKKLAEKLKESRNGLIDAKKLYWTLSVILRSHDEEGLSELGKKCRYSNNYDIKISISDLVKKPDTPVLAVVLSAGNGPIVNTAGEGTSNPPLPDAQVFSVRQRRNVRARGGRQAKPLQTQIFNRNTEIQRRYRKRRADKLEEDLQLIGTFLNELKVTLKDFYGKESTTLPPGLDRAEANRTHARMSRERETQQRLNVKKCKEILEDISEQRAGRTVDNSLPEILDCFNSNKRSEVKAALQQSNPDPSRIVRSGAITSGVVTTGNGTVVNAAGEGTSNPPPPNAQVVSVEQRRNVRAGGRRQAKPLQARQILNKNKECQKRYKQRQDAKLAKDLQLVKECLNGLNIKLTDFFGDTNIPPPGREDMKEYNKLHTYRNRERRKQRLENLEKCAEILKKISEKPEERTVKSLEEILRCFKERKQPEVESALLAIYPDLSRIARSGAITSEYGGASSNV